MIALVYFFVAATVTLAALLPLRRIAVRFGIVDSPGPRKVHSLPVPYLGGVAMLVGMSVALLVFHSKPWGVVVLIAFVAALGLADDIRYLPVGVKIVGEIGMASAAVALGFSWGVSDSAGLNAAFSVVWMVGLTNSFNLLDNMDGLASTVAALSVITIGLLVPNSTMLVAPIAGAAAGFLIVNKPPARMFMGDAGSLALGFGVALCSISAANSTRGLHSAVILVAPVAVGLFDTSLVIVSRLVTSRPIQLGGKDHFSHRLTQLGWSPYQILIAVALGCAAAWAGATLALRYPLPESWLAIPIVLAYVFAWAGLLRVDPYTSAVHHGLEVHGAKGS